MLKSLRPSVYATPSRLRFSAWRQRNSVTLVRKVSSSGPSRNRVRQSNRGVVASGVFAEVSSGAVSAQHLVEVLSGKPLIQHALQSLASIVAWFALAFLVTRVFEKLAKDCETPEASRSMALMAWGRPAPALRYVARNMYP